MENHLENIMLDSGLSINWRDFTKNTYVALNGIYLTDIGKGYVKGEIELKSELMNPTGILHGGVMVTLADTVAIFGCGYSTRSSTSPRWASPSRF